MKALLMLFGRWALGAVFLVSAAQRVWQWESFVSTFGSYNIPLPPIVLFLAIALELAGAFCLIVGFRTRFAAAFLLAVLAPLTFYFCAFWILAPGEAQNTLLLAFLRNCAIGGGLLYILAEGPGTLSHDAWRWRKASERLHDAAT